MCIPRPGAPHTAGVVTEARFAATPSSEALRFQTEDRLPRRSTEIDRTKIRVLTKPAISLQERSPTARNPLNVNIEI